MAQGNFGVRSHVSRSGAAIPFTELGFGTAPLGNLYRALDEDVAALTVNAAWERRHPLFRHRTALRPWPL